MSASDTLGDWDIYDDPRASEPPSALGTCPTCGAPFGGARPGYVEVWALHLCVPAKTPKPKPEPKKGPKK